MNQFGTLLMWLGVLLVAVPYPVTMVASWFRSGVSVDPGYGWGMFIMVIFTALAGFVMIVAGLIFKGLATVEAKMSKKTKPMLVSHTDLGFRSQATAVIKTSIIAWAFLWGCSIALGIAQAELWFSLSPEQHRTIQVILSWLRYGIVPAGILFLLGAFLKSKRAVTISQ